jgi:hypothetical protein
MKKPCETSQDKNKLLPYTWEFKTIEPESLCLTSKLSSASWR